MLNQDTSRNFLNSSDPKDKYKVTILQSLLILNNLRKKEHARFIDVDYDQRTVTNALNA